MKKLRIEELEVESFATLGPPPGRGTVRGQEDDSTSTSYDPTRELFFTCQYTCAEGYWASCNGTCDGDTCAANPTCNEYCGAP